MTMQLSFDAVPNGRDDDIGGRPAAFAFPRPAAAYPGGAAAGGPRDADEGGGGKHGNQACEHLAGMDEARAWGESLARDLNECKRCCGPTFF